MMTPELETSTHTERHRECFGLYILHQWEQHEERNTALIVTRVILLKRGCASYKTAWCCCFPFQALTLYCLHTRLHWDVKYDCLCSKKLIEFSQSFPSGDSLFWPSSWPNSNVTFPVQPNSVNSVTSFSPNPLGLFIGFTSQWSQESWHQCIYWWTGCCIISTYRQRIPHIDSLKFPIQAERMWESWGDNHCTWFRHTLYSTCFPFVV